MDLTNLDTIKQLLGKFSTIAEKKFGQNFLINREVLFNLIQAAELRKSDTVIEVGPGIGTVTKELSINAKNVYSFEIDENKLPVLEETLKENTNIKIINKDFLQIEIDEFLKTNKIKNYKFVSSLPYNISKKILQTILESKNKPDLISVLIQKEVAEKYVPKKKRTFLSNYLELLGEGKIIMTTTPSSFFPEPKIDSSVLQIIPIKNAILDKTLVKFIKNGFRNPRKKVINVIRSIYKDFEWKKFFKELGLQENSRAEDLGINNWINLYKYYKNGISN